MADYLKFKSWYLEYPVSNPVVEDTEQFLELAVDIFLKMKPFNDYLNQIRIAKSKALLKCDGLRITDISIAVGFMDQSYFTKVFKRVTGVTPNKYRDKLKAN